MRKAYVVTADSVEASVLVFAESHSKAKGLAIGSDFLCDCAYVDLICTRKPEADGFGDGNCVVDGSGAGHSKIMRLIGWYELDGNLEECAACGLFEFGDLPSSCISEEDGLCAECREDRCNI